ncbi:hypothetical protein V6N13_055061 [Hibiscus sabdariffa]|uniref:Uncharacterized protein n=1 Tax=Hibiscus sabdariffa TaxID=183260 RepID=A0ABR2DVV9_9ROSI
MRNPRSIIFMQERIFQRSTGEAGKMEPLVQVYISHNHLTGTLPSTEAFLVINETSVVGNDLCGGDIPSCKKLKNRAWWVLIACSLAASLLLAVAAFGFFFHQWKKQFGAGKSRKRR